MGMHNLCSIHFLHLTSASKIDANCFIFHSFSPQMTNIRIVEYQKESCILLRDHFEVYCFKMAVK